MTDGSSLSRAASAAPAEPAPRRRSRRRTRSPGGAGSCPERLHERGRQARPVAVHAEAREALADPRTGAGRDEPRRLGQHRERAGAHEGRPSAGTAGTARARPSARRGRAGRRCARRRSRSARRSSGGRRERAPRAGRGEEPDAVHALTAMVPYRSAPGPRRTRRRAAPGSGATITLAPSVPISDSLAWSTAASRNACPLPGTSTTPSTGEKYSVVSIASASSPPTSTSARRAPVPTWLGGVVAMLRHPLRRCPGTRRDRSGAAATAVRSAVTNASRCGQSAAEHDDLAGDAVVAAVLQAYRGDVLGLEPEVGLRPARQRGAVHRGDAHRASAWSCTTAQAASSQPQADASPTRLESSRSGQAGYREAQSLRCGRAAGLGRESLDRPGATVRRNSSRGPEHP